MTHLPESDWGVAVWMNPHRSSKPQSRLLETIVSASGSDPMAFPIKTASAISLADIESKIMSSTRDNPLIIPVPMAREWLGWDNFCFISEDMESK